MKSSLFIKGKEYSIEEVQSILKENSKTSIVLFYNVYGWNTYFTTESTFATPTGKLYKEGFPAKVRINVDGEIQPIKFTI